MACGGKGGYGRAKGTVRSKAEPWSAGGALDWPSVPKATVATHLLAQLD